MKTRPVVAARKRRRLAKSRILAPLLWAGRLIIPVYLRWALKFTSIDIRHADAILSALQAFQRGRIRLIIAFRHPYGDESQLLFHVFNNLLPRLARLSGNPLPDLPRPRFIHGYEVALWGDALIRFLLPRVGAVPIYHVKFDPASLRNIRSILLDGLQPLALAPEGQVSYRSETLPRLEQGSVRMGFWCARDLEKAGRQEKVLILPLSIHYQYDPRDQQKLLRLLARLEAACGLQASPRGSKESPAGLPERITALDLKVLDLTEAYYGRTCGSSLNPAFKEPPEIETVAGSEAGLRQRRWDAVMSAALESAERTLGLAVLETAADDRIRRVYRIRQECWDRIYPEQSAENQGSLATALADRRAGEAWFAMRHMEFVDLMHYLDTAYAAGRPGIGPTYDRTVETVCNLADLVSRLMGGNISDRPNIIRKKAVILPGRLLDLSERLESYHQDSKKAAQEATAELGNHFTDCIKEYWHEQTD